MDRRRFSNGWSSVASVARAFAWHVPVSRWRARFDDSRRRLLHDVTRTFIAALYWQRRVALAEENVAIHAEIERVAIRRHDLGDGGGLEQSMATLASVRARTELERARASLRNAHGRLRALLGETRLPTCRGDLRDLPIPSVDDIEQRGDVRALQREIEQARAREELGSAERVPDIALGGTYARDERDDVIRGTVAVSLPLFDRGQGTRAVARARRERARDELDALRATTAIELATARTQARDLIAALERFESEGLEPIERAERISTASWRAGAIPLTELLPVRRELVRAKREHADLLFEAAAARADLAAITSALQ